MKRILFVEDDALIARIYKQKLTEAGYEVFVAVDGFAAMKQLATLPADLMVLDILMPRLDGIDVLRFIRQNPKLKATRVIVLANAFMADTREKLAQLGVEEMLLKSAITPQQLIECIGQALNRPETGVVDPAPSPETKPGGTSRRESAVEFGERIRRDFYDQIPTIREALGKAAGEFLAARDEPTQVIKLEGLIRKLGFLTHMTAMAGCHRIAQLSSVFEALLFELHEKPSIISESSLHTTATTIALLSESLSRADQADEQCLSPTSILVVDDDAVSNRALYLALSRYRLNPTFVLDPFVALKKARQTAYDLVLLDINLPGMDGINMCEQMRKLPLHQSTPVIFITSHMEFEPRARSILRAGDDLITKPILPVELTVKVIASSLKKRMKLNPPQPERSS
ncbi:MAG: response regulator [Akkermansiaceae bacterium]|nr:response regulator [Verrucomicrobiales bacterium]